jgi:hypothetical protein
VRSPWPSRLGPLPRSVGRASSPVRLGPLPRSVGRAPSPSQLGSPRTDPARPETCSGRSAGERSRRAGRRGGARARPSRARNPCRERAACPEDDGYRHRRLPGSDAFQPDPGRAWPRSGRPPRERLSRGRTVCPGPGSRGYRECPRSGAPGSESRSRCPHGRPAAEGRWPDLDGARPRGGPCPPGWARRPEGTDGTGRASRPPRTARSGSPGRHGEAVRAAHVSGGHARVGAGRPVRRPG